MDSKSLRKEDDRRDEGPFCLRNRCWTNRFAVEGLQERVTLVLRRPTNCEAGSPLPHVQVADRLTLLAHQSEFADAAGVITDRRRCVKTVSHTLRTPGQALWVTVTRRCTSMLREVVDRSCVGAIWRASARAAGIYFQACSFNHSDISPSLESITYSRI